MISPVNAIITVISSHYEMLEQSLHDPEPEDFKSVGTRRQEQQQLWKLEYELENQYSVQMRNCVLCY